MDGANGMNDVQIVAYPKPLTTMDMILESFGEGKNVLAGTAFEGIENAFKDWSASESGKVYARMPYEFSIR